MRLLKLAPALALAVPLSAQQTPRPITLDEAVRLAQRNAPAAVQARGQVRVSDAAVRSSYAAFLPNITVRAGRNYQAGTPIQTAGRPVNDISSWNNTTGATFSMDLLDGGQRIFEIKRARADEDAAAANEVATQYRVSLEVKQAYFAALAARESEASARAQLQQAQQQFTAANARKAAGAATKSDSLRSMIQVGNAQLALVTAQNNLRSAEATLTRLVATPFPVTALPDTLDVQSVSADSAELVRLAVGGPAVRQAEAQHVAARAGAKVARAPYLPTVNVSYSRSGTGDERFGWGDPYRYTTQLNFGLQYPLFNQLNREEARVRADIAEDNAEATLRDARLLAQQQLVQYLGALRSAEQRIVIQRASVAAAEEDVRVQQQRYSVGASSLLDLLTSQTELNRAREALIAARQDYRIAKAQLEALVGRAL